MNSNNANQKPAANSNTANPKNSNITPQKVLDNANLLINKGNKALDKADRFVKKLKFIKKLVSVFMWINIIIFIITALICSISIYRTVNMKNAAIAAECIDK